MPIINNRKPDVIDLRHIKYFCLTNIIEAVLKIKHLDQIVINQRQMNKLQKDHEFHNVFNSLIIPGMKKDAVGFVYGIELRVK